MVIEVKYPTQAYSYLDWGVPPAEVNMYSRVDVIAPANSYNMGNTMPLFSSANPLLPTKDSQLFEDFVLAVHY